MRPWPVGPSRAAGGCVGGCAGGCVGAAAARQSGNPFRRPARTRYMTSGAAARCTPARPESGCSNENLDTNVLCGTVTTSGRLPDARRPTNGGAWGGHATRRSATGRAEAPAPAATGPELRGAIPVTSPERAKRRGRRQRTPAAGAGRGGTMSAS